MQVFIDDSRWIKHDNLSWILVAQALAILPILFHLPLWLGVVWLLALVWRVQIYLERLPFPSTFVKAVTAGVIVTALILSSAGKFSIDLLIGLFFSAYVLKLLEFRKKRDGLLLVFLGFFAIATQFLFVQTMLAAAYGFLSCVVLLAAWKVLYFDRPASINTKLKSGGRLLLHALPLMVLFFIIMPRIEPLWSLPSLTSSGRTGFGDTMSPGDVGKLVESSATAFRVEFEGDAPPKESLYWRGLVLDYFDGRSWRVYPRNSAQEQQKAKPILGAKTRYTVTMEPHGQHWLFALTEPVSLKLNNDKVKQDQRLFITSKKPVNQRVQYSVESVLSDRHGQRQSLNEKTLAENLLIPRGLNPKTQQQVQQWLDEGLNPQQIIQRALDQFTRSFYYTLEPALLGRHSIDDFLFTTQKGFCEHFASSFVFMMRSAGIPARVVVGYQGASKSDVQDYYVVKQSDAHAWAEVWLQGIGWLRIDPTAAVAPERVETGISEALSDSDLQFVGSNALDQFPLARFIAQHADAIGYAWNRWVLSYDNRSQQGLLEKLFGGTEYWRIALVVMLASFMIGAGFYLYFVLSNRARHVPQEVRLINRFIKKAKKLGIEPNQGETISSLIKRITVKYPELADPAIELGGLFERVAYGGENQELEKLRQGVNAFPVSA